MKRFRTEGGEMAYRDEGAGPAVVFVHGTPSSSAEFAGVVSTLKHSYRCIAIDLLGFGESDKPAEADYSISAHARRLAALVDALTVDRFHLVAHDFGGAIGLLTAQRRWNRVLSVTLMNTWGWPLAETEPALVRQRPLLRSAAMRWLYRRFNFSARVLVKAAWGTYRPLTREKHRAYQRPFQTAAERGGTVAFLRALTDESDPAWHVHRFVAEAAQKPTLLLWGLGDPIVSRRTLERWQSILPHARTTALERVGHFVADEAPELVTDALRGHLQWADERGAGPTADRGPSAADQSAERMNQMSHVALRAPSVGPQPAANSEWIRARSERPERRAYVRHGSDSQG